MLLVLALQAAAAGAAATGPRPAPADALPANLRDRTAAAIPCRSTSDKGEVVVCALRRADRYRVPFVVHDEGDPKHEAVRMERERLLARTDNCSEKSTFLVGCGSWGLSAVTSVGGGGVQMRKPAP